ncbi:hypothetical protein VPH35_069223 [Triticum aestivum]
MEVVSAIVKVVQEIAKAVETDRENSESCLDLADRARTVGDIIHHLDSSTASTRSSGSGRTVMIREPSLKRLKAALNDALKLVESQQPSGFLGGHVNRLINSGTTADRFQRVEARINACVNDVGLAEQFAARHRALRANRRTVSAPSLAPERHHQSSQSAPPPSQHQQRFLSTLGSSQQHESSRPTTSPLQQRRSPRLSQQNQSFQSEEWSTQQQRSSHTTPPSQQHQNMRQHQQQRRLQSGESSSQQQQNSQSAVRSPQQGRSRRQHLDSQPAAPHHYRRRSALTPNQARELASAISSQPAPPPRGAGAAAP